MIFFKRKKTVDPDRRDRALQTTERREAQTQLKQRVERMMSANAAGNLNAAKS